jgi:DNA-binding CsgD family transcriptional regulator
MIALAPMASAEERAEPAKASVLLYTQDPFKGKSYVAALEKATIPVECVTTASELRLRLERADLPRPALVMVLPSRGAPMRPRELTSLASRLLLAAVGGEVPQRPTSALDDALGDYCAARSLSARQRQVLELYLIGKHDKEIACSFNCSATTVYEHWRRMAKKANGVHKSDVVNDFHRFLATRSDGAVTPQLPSSLPPPGRSLRPSP